MQKRSEKFFVKICAVILVLFLISACTYKDRVAPVQLPSASGGVNVNGLLIAAKAFTDPAEAESALGFNARKAGLLPVQVTFQNNSPHRININPEQTFLIDTNNNAWPILSQQKTYERTKKYVDVGETVKGAGKPSLLMGAAGAIAGAAIGIISGENVGEALGKGAVAGAALGAIVGGAKSYEEAGGRIQHEMAVKGLKNKTVLQNEIAYGALFFPGFSDAEAQGAVELRLSLTMDEKLKIVTIPLAEQ